MGDLKEVQEEWSRFMQGDSFDPPEGATPQALQHWVGHLMQKEKIHELDEEYRVNFEDHLLKTAINAQKFMREAAQESMANKIAGEAIMRGNAGLE